MRNLSFIILVLFLASLLGGCIVRSNHHHRGRGHAHARKGKSCPPAYHWNGYKCVHNGRGKAKGHRR